MFKYFWIVIVLFVLVCLIGYTILAFKDTYKNITEEKTLLNIINNFADDYTWVIIVWLIILGLIFVFSLTIFAATNGYGG